ncbi:MAG: EF-hand domain-containing protein, partial [Pseudomonadota bacterium]
DLRALPRKMWCRSETGVDEAEDPGIEQVDAMREIFRLLDLDHNNSIDSDELAKMLRTVGMPADANRVRRFAR